MRLRVAPDALNSGALAHHPLEGPGPEPSDDYPLRVPCCSYLSIETVSFAELALASRTLVGSSFPPIVKLCN